MNGCNTCIKTCIAVYMYTENNYNKTLIPSCSVVTDTNNDVMLDDPSNDQIITCSCQYKNIHFYMEIIH